MVKITSAEEGFISMGPWGGQKGEEWAYKPNGRITEIIVRHGGAIDSLLFKSESCDGFPLEPSQKFGGGGGNRTDKVCIDGAEEYLTTISMTSGDFDGQSVVKTPSSVNLLVQRDPGPWGAQRGRQWDDGVFLVIKQVILRTGSPECGHTVIQGIQFKYEQRDGSSFTSPWHGCSFSGGTGPPLAKGESPILIELNYEGEIIVGIEGFYGPAKGTDGFEVITSISIYTNKRKFGPIGGSEIGTHFSSTLSDGKVVGFFGRSGTYLNAIGIHTEYC